MQEIRITDAGEKPPIPADTGKPTSRPGLVAAGLLIMVLAAFMTPLMARNAFIALNQDQYKPDELIVEYYSEREGSFGGHVVSSGETYADDSTNLVGDLDFVRRLQREKRLIGYRAPILYIREAKGFWKVMDLFSWYRFIRPDERDNTSVEVLIPLVTGTWLAGIIVFRRGVRPRRSPPAFGQQDS